MIVAISNAGAKYISNADWQDTDGWRFCRFLSEKSWWEDQRHGGEHSYPAHRKKFQWRWSAVVLKYHWEWTAPHHSSVTVKIASQSDFYIPSQRRVKLLSLIKGDDLDAMRLWDLIQHVMEETHRAQNTLNLVMTVASDGLDVTVEVDPTLIISDHACVTSVHSLPRITAPMYYKVVRSWR